MNQQDIEQVVKAVLLKMQSSDTPPAAVHEMGVFASLDDAVAAAKVAQQGLKSVAMRQLAIAAIREAGEKHARDLAELAVSETGMGRVEDKFAKNVAQARGTPGVECLSPQVLTGDNGLTLIETQHDARSYLEKSQIVNNSPYRPRSSLSVGTTESEKNSERA